MAKGEQWQPNIATTKAQVSGHRFFQRRVALGLVIGDERLIHDPLTRRNRATIVGVIAVVLLLVGAGLLAIIRPEPAIGDSALIQDDYGQLYVFYEEQWHPVTNLTSARLLLAQPDEPEQVAAKVLADLEMAPPLGISDAPQIFSANQPPAVFDHPWLGCIEQRAHHPRHADGANAMLIGSAPPEILAPLKEDAAVLVPTAEGEYLLSHTGGELTRQKLLDPRSLQGRALRDYLGITTTTPRWVAPPALLALIPEVPGYSWPAQGKIVRKDERAWFIAGNKSQVLTPLQEELLAAGGNYEQQRVNEIPQQTASSDLVRLPEKPWDFQTTAGDTWCVRASATKDTKEQVGNFSTGGDLEDVEFSIDFGRLDQPVVRTEVAAIEQSQPGEVEDIPLYYFHRTYEQVSPSVTRLALTGSGYHVLSETGVRHRIDEVATAGMIGIAAVTIMPWELLQVLPQGSVLSPEQAAVQVAGTAGANPPED